MSESDLLRKVIPEFEARGWEVYQEIAMGNTSACGVADLVLVCDGRVMILEGKTSLGLSVLAQADRWRSCANWVGIVVPDPARDARGYRRQSIGREFAYKIAEERGIGIWSPGNQNWHAKPSLNRRADTEWLQELTPEMKNCAEAGTDRGGYWTPFKGTCDNVVRYIRKHPGCTLREVIEKISHHYASDSSARSCISSFLRTDRLRPRMFPGVRLEYEGRTMRLFCDATERARA